MRGEKVMNGFYEYGKKLEELGKRMQNPDTSLRDLVEELDVLGLAMEFRIAPVASSGDRAPEFEEA